MPSTADDALVLFPGALGDCICFLPTLRALRARHSGRLLVIIKPAVAELIQLSNTITASIDRREVADLFSSVTPIAVQTQTLLGGFAWAYSWTGFGDPAFRHRLAAVTGGTAWVYEFRGMSPNEHAVDYYARCVGVVPISPIVASDLQWLSSFEHVHRLHDRRLLLIHPGSGSPKKNWAGFDRLIRCWGEHHDDVIVQLHGPAETERRGIVGPRVMTIGGLSLTQVAALLNRCGLYAGNDSGISHLAGAVGVPGVVLFGPTDSTVWAPRAVALRVIQAADACSRCPSDTFCVHRLPVETVLDALGAQEASVQP